MSEPAKTSQHAFAGFIIFAALVGASVGSLFSSQGDLASSRLATVYAITNYGTWYIDRPDNTFARDTIDKVTVRGIEADGVMRGGHLISSKPPMMPLVMTGIYVAVRAMTEWDLSSEEAIDGHLVVMTIVMISFSYALTLLFFYKTLLLFDLTQKQRLFLLCALAFGTELGGFCSTINNHVPAAAAVMASLYFALSLLTGKKSPTWWRFAAFGVAGALVPTLDMPVGIYVAAAGLALLVRFPRLIGWTFLAAIPILAVHFYFTWAVTGSPLPVQMRPATYMYEAAYWRHPLGIDALSEPKLTYLFHITIGRAGLFSLFPITILGIAAAVIPGIARKNALFAACAAGLVCFVVLTAYYVTSTHNYGGEAYGFRWYIASVPVVMLMAVPVVMMMHKRWHWILASLLLIISVYSTAESALTGWQSGQEWTSRIFGPAYRQVASQPPTQ